MFRKGGDVGGGIMDNIVERRNYSTGPDKDDFSTLSDRIEFIEGLGGSKSGLEDPLTKFLLELGPNIACLLYTSPSPRDGLLSRMPSSA